ERRRIEVGEASNTQTCGRKLSQQLEAIYRKTRLDADDWPGAKRPTCRRLCAAHDQATVLLELPRWLGFPCLLEVVGASKNAHALGHLQAPRDEPRILEWAKADGYVESFLDEVHTVVRQVDIDDDGGITSSVLQQHFLEEALTQLDCSRQTDGSLRFPLSGGDHRVCCPQRGNSGLHLLQITRANVSKRHGPRGARQQTCSQGLFQSRDALAHRRLRYTQGQRGLPEPSLCNHLD